MGRFVKTSMELGLGTAQFGMDYGVSNQSGRPPEVEVERILGLADQHGLVVLDTAASYGGAEELLGRCIPRDSSFRVITKTVPLGEAREKADAPRLVREGFERSLERLGMSSVDGLLAHHAADLFGRRGAGIFAELEDLRRMGMVRRIGLSVYTGDEIDMALDRYDFDLIQVPANILDQRLLRGGHLTRLVARGVEVHMRSVFLQGLLLMDPETVPAYFDPVRTRLTAWRRALDDRGLTPAQGALGFARSLDGVSVVLVGVENAEQLAANIKDFAVAESANVDFTCHALNDERFVNPAKWKLAA